MVDADLFSQINNAILDLQAADLQSYERPLKTLARLLSHPDLADINKELTEGLDVEAFLAESEKSQHSMMGSAKLAWPDSKQQEMGLTLLLIRKFGTNPEFIVNFGHTFFYSGSSKIISFVQSVTRQLIIPFIRDYKSYVANHGMPTVRLVKYASKKIFIVHGHDGEARESVARFVALIGFDPVILHEQPNRGQTVIEKVEANGDVGFAIVLLTPDDQGSSPGGPLEPRARQNVLLELGYFIGRLGRSRVCALKRGEIEIPSDFAGVVWTTMDAGNGWKIALAKELEAAGYEVDWKGIAR